jgi:hypothetical protein
MLQYREFQRGQILKYEKGKKKAYFLQENVTITVLKVRIQ